MIAAIHGILKRYVRHYASFQDVSYIDFGQPIDLNGKSISVGGWFRNDVDGWRLVQNRGTGTLGTRKGFQISTLGATWQNTAIDNGAGAAIDFADVPHVEKDLPNWHHAFLTFDTTTGTAKFYIDGVVKSTKTNPGLIGADLNSSRNLTIGAAWDNATTQSQFIRGGVDDVRLYTRLLSDVEVLNVYKRTEDLTGLALWARLNGNANDSSGNGYHGTIYNSSASTPNNWLTFKTE